MGADHSTVEDIDLFVHNASTGDIDGVAHRLSLLNASNSQGETALIAAVTNQQEEMVSFLLSRSGIHVNCKDEACCTPLLLAFSTGNAAMVHTLVDAKANMLQIDNNGWGILHHAVQGGSFDMVKYAHEYMRDHSIQLPSKISSAVSRSLPPVPGGFLGWIWGGRIGTTPGMDEERGGHDDRDYEARRAQDSNWGPSDASGGRAARLPRGRGEQEASGARLPEQLHDCAGMTPLHLAAHGTARAYADRMGSRPDCDNDDNEKDEIRGGGGKDAGNHGDGTNNKTGEDNVNGGGDDEWMGIVEYLLLAGFSPLAKDGNGDLPIDLLENMNTGDIEQLLREGAEVEVDHAEKADMGEIYRFKSN